MNWRILLLPFSLIYAFIASIRNFLFNTGILKQQSFQIPVLLVGNLSMGGTGKTPHVEYLIKLLDQTYSLATLSRGYGRKSKGFVMAGKGVSSTEIGDEPMQYFLRNKNITVGVCEDRVTGIQKLISSKESLQLIIMDDGFQHRSVKPSFSILLTTYDQLFTKDYVLPAGNLRETKSGYKRADCIVVTKIPDNLTDSQKQDVQIEIYPQSHQQLYFSSIVYGNPISFFDYNEISIDKLSGYHVILFTGIANAKPLITFIQNNSSSLSVLSYPDHYEYTAKDISRIVDKFTAHSKDKTIVLTTEKDYLRLYGTPLMEQLISLPCYYIPVTVKLDRPNDFNKMIFEAINNFKYNT